MNFLQLFEKNRFSDYFLSRKWSEMKGGKFKNLPPTHKGTKRCKDKRLKGTWKGVERRKKERERGRGGERRPRVQAVTCNYPVLAGSKAA